MQGKQKAQLDVDQQTNDRVTELRPGHDRSFQKDRAKHPSIFQFQPAFVERFEKPKAQDYPLFPSLMSILSLLIMSYVSAYLFVELIPSLSLSADLFPGHTWLSSFLPPISSATEIPVWAWLPFAFTIFGATLGWVFESYLVLQGHAFQQQRTKLNRFIQSIRLENLAPVTGTIFFAVCMMSFDNTALLTALVYITVGVSCLLGTALLLGGTPWLPPALLLVQVGQILIVLSSDLSGLIKGLLVGQAVLQSISLTIGAMTPWKSTAFHLISTVSGILLYVALIDIAGQESLMGSGWEPTPLSIIGVLFVGMLGIHLAFKLNPKLYNQLRSVLSNAIWSLQYFLLISAPRFPNPVALGAIYSKENPPKPVTLKPYYQQHPEFLPQPLSIPAVTHLERNVTQFKSLLTTVKRTFKMIALLDHVFPQSNTKTANTQKPRLAIWSDGQDVFPAIYRKKILGLSVPGQRLDPTPETAIEAYKEGQLLAFLAESGVANPFLKKGKTPGMLIMDFRFLEQYETKPDFEPYGGVAHLKINDDKQRIELLSICPPKSKDSILVNPDDASFRHAERQFIASMYFYVISGKHLAEIHMTYNLVEAAMHNAFDAQGQWNHPLRTFMYLHFFSHELAEELTTEHLVQEGAVFSQVFATTHDSLIHYLNDRYHEFDYGEDEDFEVRIANATMSNGQLLPNSCMQWELEYAKIWQHYTTQLIDIIYSDDQAVCKDQYLQNLYQGLQEVLLQGLPPRYDDFQTKQGVARWASDTIHHMVVRHQVYGTTGVRAAMDPRISDIQVPKDGGTPSVDGWRSLISVALATAKARFTLLVGENKKDFTYLLKDVDPKFRQPMAEVFDQLQTELYALNQKWNRDDVEKAYNYDYFRALPSELHTGPGY